jgi:hypothetical protein
MSGAAHGTAADAAGTVKANSGECRLLVPSASATISGARELGKPN